MSRRAGGGKPPSGVAAVETVKLAEVSPSFTVTLSGTWKVTAAELTTPARLTTAPPAGAGWLKVTVACTDSPATTEDCESPTPCEKFWAASLGTHITAWVLAVPSAEPLTAEPTTLPAASMPDAAASVKPRGVN